MGVRVCYKKKVIANYQQRLHVFIIPEVKEIFRSVYCNFRKRMESDIFSSHMIFRTIYRSRVMFTECRNLHGGSVVASYPFDDSASHVMSGRVSAAPDDALFKHLAHT